MLLAQALRALIDRWSEHELPQLAPSLMQLRVPLIIIQIVGKLLQDQQSSGLWGAKESCEETAYALLALKSLGSLFKEYSVHANVNRSIESASTYLQQHHSEWEEGCYLWIEKVSYRAPLLSQTYCLAAVGCVCPSSKLGDRIFELLRPPGIALSEQIKFFSSLSILSCAKLWCLEVSVLEGSLFQQRLIQSLPDIFPNKKLLSERFMTFVPITWTIIKNTFNFAATNEQLLAMMTISILVYQVDEYMEE